MPTATNAVVLPTELALDVCKALSAAGGFGTFGSGVSDIKLNRFSDSPLNQLRIRPVNLARPVPLPQPGIRITLRRERVDQVEAASVPVVEFLDRKTPTLERFKALFRFDFGGEVYFDENNRALLDLVFSTEVAHVKSTAMP